MENATKALLIAAAVLVAILIISLGLVIYNMASETINGVNFSGQEVQAFNDQFLKYRGDRLRGTQINALLNTAFNSNLKSVSEGLSSKDGAKFVSVKVDNTAMVTPDSDTAPSLVDTSKLYGVVINTNSTTGFVEDIVVTALAGK